MSDDPKKPDSPFKLNRSRIDLLLLGALLVTYILSAMLGGRGERRQFALAQPVHVAQPDGLGHQRLARPHYDPAGTMLELDHVERLAGGDAETLPLPDRVVDDALVLPQHSAVEMDDFALLQ